MCEKSFNQSSARNIHMKIHTGKRSYVCQICSSAFTQSASLKRHMKIHINTDLNENSNDEPVMNNFMNNAYSEGINQNISSIL